jgi:ketosteroid isomerase-like protein
MAVSEQNLEVVRRANAALNRGDIEGALSDYVEGAEIRDLRSAPDQPFVASGKEAIMAIWAEWNAAFQELRADVDEWIEAGDFVILRVHWVGIGRESGLSIDTRQYDLFEVRDGMIVRGVLGYPSKEEALDAARSG